jgi:hypothetical protein
MYRSDLRIEIDGEDVSSSASFASTFEEHIGISPQWDILCRLKTGLAMMAIVTLVNTVPIGDAQEKIKAAPSAIVEKGEGRISYEILAEPLEDRMTDDEFNKSMAALEDIWHACPKDLPKDLSLKHDYYLFGTRG